MELLEGMDLQSMVKEHGPLPEARAVHLLVQVCHSLEEAHSVGLVHRDIKPANLFVGKAGRAYDFVKVLDFGLVKLEEAAPVSSDGPLTDAGTVVGTPGYMAPELTVGGEATPRSDLYALGCVAYFVLTGRLVFEGRGPLQQLFAHAHEEPDPVSKWAPVGEALAAVVMRCLAKDPSERPSSAAALAAALRAAVPADGWTDEDARRFWAERPSRAAAAPSSESAAVAPTAPRGRVAR
ncbi:MAG: serine/threonine protein kinase [Sandaracinaceae bacterium]|nr:serine/threonine protein kinase [Sandaracinaceae bacterium]